MIEFKELEDTVQEIISAKNKILTLSQIADNSKEFQENAKIMTQDILLCKEHLLSVIADCQKIAESCDEKNAMLINEFNQQIRVFMQELNESISAISAESQAKISEITENQITSMGNNVTNSLSENYDKVEKALSNTKEKLTTEYSQQMQHLLNETKTELASNKAAIKEVVLFSKEDICKEMDRKLLDNKKDIVGLLTEWENENTKQINLLKKIVFISCSAASVFSLLAMIFNILK